MNRTLFLFIVFLSTTTIFAQSDILDNYIKIALESNLALQQKEYSYQKSLEALKESKRMFLPSISLNASYTVAEGGRILEIPFGDMLNPIYNNLNQINPILNPTAQQYPEIENMEIPLIRSTEQETYLQAGMPVFNAAIIQNHKIKQGLATVESINVEIYKRELVKEVKEAYIKYLQAEQIYILYSNTLEIVKLNLKFRESLFANDKITIDEVYAAKAQIMQVERDLVEADKNRVLATLWFNFLLNRDFDSDIDTGQFAAPIISGYNIQDITNTTLSNREELTQMDTYIEIQENNIKLQKGAALPEVSLFGQYGFQGEDYRFDNESDLAVAGVSLKWNIFNAGQRKSKIQQAKIDCQIIESQKLELERQLQLEVVNAYYSIQVAQKSIELAEQELDNFRKTYSLVEKKYQQGMVNYLDYSNALNNLLNAEIKLILALYEYQLEQINLERLTSTYQF
ncbi:MAG: TolC family protein [Bacteroidales bacterium]|nr:TolC family protein [Bacteroidales bacterium]